VIQILIGGLVLIGIAVALERLYDRAVRAAMEHASRTARQWGEADLLPEQRARLDEFEHRWETLVHHHHPIGS
jgi:hypothetical protein